ncbi:dihydroflavonol-4-reductase [Exophiala viscosa]|uniref:Dihydroflavonol-4-reductase n=1 Tax=Exophiala viscosa TaxID=2486360 RepID=A0AAN6E6H5_9EURO|nr:dihydroflavonol-4-reductase [Exophiala viscosa]
MGSTTSPSDKIILVTGINGYIASHIGLILLQKGYIVRGTSRSESAHAHLISGAFKSFADRYQHAVVPDITAPGAFDDAVRSVHAIIHTASPVDFTLTSVEAFIRPAVDGTLSILNSALVHAGPQLASVVVTSSVAAVVDKWRQPPTHAYSEADWNTSGESVARETFTAPVAYGASKAAAERALWDFVATHEPAQRWSVSAVNPGVVTGPPVSFPENPEKLNETLAPIWRVYSGSQEMPPQIGGASYIDVRDVADMHIWCVEHPDQANGQRYLMTNGKAPPQAAADFLREKFPDRDIVEGTPGLGYRKDDYWFVEGEPSLVANKAYKALGVERFIRYDKSILDTVEAFERRWPGYAKNLKR